MKPNVKKEIALRVFDLLKVQKIDSLYTFECITAFNHDPEEFTRLVTGLLEA